MFGRLAPVGLSSELVLEEVRVRAFGLEGAADADLDGPVGSVLDDAEELLEELLSR